MRSLLELDGASTFHLLTPWVVPIVQARIVVIVTTEESNLQNDHYSTRLDMAGRLACDHRGYLVRLPVDSGAAAVWRLLQPVADLLRVTSAAQSGRRRSTLSVHVSDFDHQPVITASLAAVTNKAHVKCSTSSLNSNNNNNNNNRTGKIVHSRRYREPIRLQQMGFRIHS